MDEQTAKTKWCPMVRSNNADLVLHDRKEKDFSVTYRVTCVGSACMMWRWEPKYELVEHQDTGGPGTVKAQPTEGYCGLAGTTVWPRY